MDLAAHRTIATFMTLGAVCAIGATSLFSGPAQAEEATGKPNLSGPLAGYEKLWKSDGKDDKHGQVLNGAVLARNDALTSWINQHATPAQQFRALQDAQYAKGDGSGYDQSMTISDGLGQRLGRLYVQGRRAGKLPLTTALVNSETGSAGAFIKTSEVKKRFSYPRPFLPADPKAKATAGDDSACAPSVVNDASLVGNRKGKPWADSDGTLKIKRVASRTDTTHAFTSQDVKLNGQYGDKSLCGGGSFPSGHTATAYQAGITLATLMPEVAPEILARTSEAANNRIVLGVHYPLDIIGGRMSGELAIATRWSDAAFRKNVLQPARAELLGYLTKACTASMHVNSLSECIAKDRPYRNSTHWGLWRARGSAPWVFSGPNAVPIYTQRMSYGFAPTSATNVAPIVPSGASNLLLTTFPTLTDAQRTAVLAQTESASGQPLAVGQGAGWQRLNLAAAMSARVQIRPDGSVRVLSTGGPARVQQAKSEMQEGLTKALKTLKTSGQSAPIAKKYGIKETNLLP